MKESATPSSVWPASAVMSISAEKNVTATGSVWCRTAEDLAKSSKVLTKAFSTGRRWLEWRDLVRTRTFRLCAATSKKVFVTAFGLFTLSLIGGVCNCDRSDCLAMRCMVTHGIPVMFRAECVAAVNPDLCNGCRLCCGCGICSSVCQKDAVRLEERSKVSAAASRW